MSPDLIEQFHRIEKKLDALIEHFIFKDEFTIPAINDKTVCPMCIDTVKWKQNPAGEIVRDCGCDMIVKSIDLSLFNSPAKKNK